MPRLLHVFTLLPDRGRRSNKHVSIHCNSMLQSGLSAARSCVFYAEHVLAPYCPHSMRRGVYATVGVRPSVCSTMGPQQQTRCCRFAAVGPVAGDVDRLLHSWRSAAVARGRRMCGQCHVVSVRRMLNTYLSQVQSAIPIRCVSLSVGSSVSPPRWCCQND